ncbi:major facilitator superfamily domain-containing protein [Ditylenchus destructor]|uniref:Major facilitator superfamily domain-containing protein n=1 Tax=Ditylenchus destructor TaxID=166010 RepID=A0AAD4RCD7_9BILA|nr:major facilitator superfamily domain-containing protein [Ditylenchus destructor]
MDAKNGTIVVIESNGKSENGIQKKMPLFHPLSRRFHVLLLIMLGYFSMVYMRTNLGMAMTCMVNSTAVTLMSFNKIAATGGGAHEVGEEDPHELLVSITPITIANLTEMHSAETHTGCHPGTVIHAEEDSTTTTAFVNDYGGDLVWDTNIQGWLFSASFYGSLVACLPAGLLADRYSPKKLLLMTGMISIICSLLLPYFANNLGYIAVFMLRFVMGLGEGFILPAINKMISQWIPSEELSTAASIQTTGNQLAGAMGIPLAAFLCSSAFRWPAIFYFCALIGFIWAMVWLVFVPESPAECKRMTDREKQYLRARIDNFGIPMQRIGRQQNDTTSQYSGSMRIPYMDMMKSAPLYSLLFCAFSANMIVVLIQVYLPSFFKEVLLLGMMNNGIFSAAPNLTQLVAKISWGIFMDKLKEKRISATFACKFSQGFSSLSVAIVLVLLSHYASCDAPYLSLSLICLMTMAFSTSTAGFYTSLLNMAPTYTGLLTSIFMMAGHVGRLTTPKIISIFNHTGTLAEWRMVFYTMIGTTLFSAVFFVIFGSGDTQSWDKSDRESIPSEEVSAKLQEEHVEMLYSYVPIKRRNTRLGSVVLDIVE